MGKAERNRRQSAQEKIAAQRAAARRAERRRQGLIAGGSVLAVLAIVVAFVLVKVLNNNNSNTASAGTASAAGATLSASVLNDVTGVPASTLDAVGTGTTYKDAIQTVQGKATPLTSGGKPVVVYVGAEYCPYCAAERWGMTIALSRFGTFSGLHGIHSSSTDVDPNTPTLTFYKSTYTSKYVVFEPTESETTTRATLQTVTSLDNQLMSKYDVPPYVPSSTYDGSFPFVDFGNKYVIAGASYDPAVLSGQTWAQVAAALKNPSSPIAKSADGAANLITAAICKLTNNQPANVCTSAGVTAANGAL
jgi:thiol-disulfide isomerase/thioredoxin